MELKLVWKDVYHSSHGDCYKCYNGGCAEVGLGEHCYCKCHIRPEVVTQ